MHDRVRQIADQPHNRHVTARGFVSKTHNELAAKLLTRDEARRIAAKAAGAVAQTVRIRVTPADCPAKQAGSVSKTSAHCQPVPAFGRGVRAEGRCTLPRCCKSRRELARSDAFPECADDGK
jgi:hypothetical protein